jgi:hypothetical protein
MASLLGLLLPLPAPCLELLKSSELRGFSIDAAASFSALTTFPTTGIRKAFSASFLSRRATFPSGGANQNDSRVKLTRLPATLG